LEILARKHDDETDIDVQSCLLGYTAVENYSLMMEAVRTYETSVDNNFTRQYIPEDNSEQATMFIIIWLYSPIRALVSPYGVS
jgi:hypothetical protein